MRKRVLLFCILVVVTMTLMKSFVERSTSGRDNQRAWRKEHRVEDRLPSPDPPPWVESTDTPAPPPHGISHWSQMICQNWRLSRKRIRSRPCSRRKRPVTEEPEPEDVVTAEVPKAAAKSSGKKENEPTVVINEIMFYPAPDRER